LLRISPIFPAATPEGSVIYVREIICEVAFAAASPEGYGRLP
jgi:hypothetical protein